MGHDAGTPMVQARRPEPPVSATVERPWSVASATIAIAAVMAGLVMWVVWTVADVQRLNREAATLQDRFDGSEGPAFYSLYSAACMAVLVAFGLLIAGAAGWLVARGRRVALFVTCVCLCVTTVLVGLPFSLIAAVNVLTGPSQRPVTAEVSFDDALTVLHTLNEPGWSPIVAVLASILIVAGSVAAVVLLLLPRSRRYFAGR